MNWIKCSEKMPKPGQRVLVKLSTMVHIMFIENGAWTDGEWVSGVGFEHIKYWHALPQPPEE